MTELRSTDPVVTEIVRNGLVAATEEMKSNLMRTAYNMIIYEALDFTVGLFDRAGNTVSIGIGLPMFIRGMSNTVKRMIKHFGYERMDEGDVLLTNDAYITGSHLNHMTFVVPIFWHGEIVGFAACMAHWQDIGGTLDGMGVRGDPVHPLRRGDVVQFLAALVPRFRQRPVAAGGRFHHGTCRRAHGATAQTPLHERPSRPCFCYWCPGTP